jgi:hypothetical protein
VRAPETPIELVVTVLQVVLGLYAVLAAVYVSSHTSGSLADWAELVTTAFTATAVTQMVGLATIGDSMKP